MSLLCIQIKKHHLYGSKGTLYNLPNKHNDKGYCLKSAEPLGG